MLKMLVIYIQHLLKMHAEKLP